MKRLLKSTLITLLFFPIYTFGEEIFTQFPTKINVSEKYVFYVHGLIVEGENQTPIHPEFGMYDFPAIKRKIFEIGGFNLIAHHRSQDTDIDEYVELFSSWVNSLLDAGVPPIKYYTHWLFQRQPSHRADGRTIQ